MEALHTSKEAADETNGRRFLFLPPLVRRDDVPEGEYRVALNGSKAQKHWGRGYYYMDAETMTFPPLATEHRLLYASLCQKVVTAQKHRNRKMLPRVLLLLSPFFVLLFTPVTVVILSGDTEGDVGDSAIANNPFFLTAFVLSFVLPFLVLGRCAKKWTIQIEYEAELKEIVEESAREWNEATEYRLSLEEDHEWPKLVYLRFQKL